MDALTQRMIERQQRWTSMTATRSPSRVQVSSRFTMVSRDGRAAPLNSVDNSYQTSAQRPLQPLEPDLQEVHAIADDNVDDSCVDERKGQRLRTKIRTVSRMMRVFKKLRQDHPYQRDNVDDDSDEDRDIMSWIEQRTKEVEELLQQGQACIDIKTPPLTPRCEDTMSAPESPMTTKQSERTGLGSPTSYISCFELEAATFAAHPQESFESPRKKMRIEAEPLSQKVDCLSQQVILLTKECQLRLEDSDQAHLLEQTVAVLSDVQAQLGRVSELHRAFESGISDKTSGGQSDKLITLPAQDISQRSTDTDCSAFSNSLDSSPRAPIEHVAAEVQALKQDIQDLSTNLSTAEKERGYLSWQIQAQKDQMQRLEQVMLRRSTPRLMLSKNSTPTNCTTIHTGFCMPQMQNNTIRFR